MDIILLRAFASAGKYLPSRCLAMGIHVIVLSCVYGSMTNNNGLWIGCLDLLTPSCTVSLNHSLHSRSYFFHSRSSTTASFGTRLS
jgi:hypothetical protein